MNFWYFPYHIDLFHLLPMILILSLLFILVSRDELFYVLHQIALTCFIPFPLSLLCFSFVILNFILNLSIYLLFVYLIRVDVISSSFTLNFDVRLWWIPKYSNRFYYFISWFTITLMSLLLWEYTTLPSRFRIEETF